MRRSNEQLVGDVSSGNLTHGTGYNRPVDRITAMALIPNLARAIVRLNAGARTQPDRSTKLRSEHISMASVELGKWVKANVPIAGSLPTDECERICRLVIYEKNTDRCATCQGRKEVRPKHAAVIICPDCSGSGKRKFDDVDRRRVFGKALNPTQEMVLAEALSAYGHHLAMAEIWVEEKRVGDEY